MNNNYLARFWQPATLFFIALTITSCSKDRVIPKPVPGSPITLGLYELGNGVNRRIFIPISKVGTKSDTTYYGVFDTGSSGLTIDATGLLPKSMITSAGITVTGDSVVVNGITVTSKTAVVSFGDKTSLTKEYGNLAYAPITIGDQNGNTTIKRIPIFLYYKVIDVNGKQLGSHSNDVFGVAPGDSYAFSNITSPLSYFATGANLTSGFRLATLNGQDFGTTGVYVSSLLTIGLTDADLAASSGFIMHPLSIISPGGYSPDIPATITYNNKSIAAEVLFDTGTPSVTIIEDKTAVNSIGNLPLNSVVTVTTNKGFTYRYTTTSTTNLTAIQNPNNTNDLRTIFSIDFFIKNEILTDYTDHEIGLKNN
ncbi:MAG: hypothetical protein JWP37_4627 [Mucilaginibacter sp.]|nr:hypothetical protein [Mucilaginibacter sp.]